MKKIQKNEKAAHICEQWAADFAQQNQNEEAGYWNGLSLAFRLGTDLNQDAIAALQRELDQKINIAKMATRGNFGQNIGKIMQKIGEEAQYLRSAIQSTLFNL